jgi:uncharacterized membrane protein
VYATLVLISIGPGSGTHTFVPHLSIVISLALVGLSMLVLIYFIHHIATSIQLPEVIASIARDLSNAIDAESTGSGNQLEAGPSVPELMRRMVEGGGQVPAPASGYLQFVRHETLIQLATEKGAVIRLLHRPGHFLVQGHAMATVWPPDAAGSVTQALRRAHITGPSRTLAQDLAFAVDQLVEIAIRALSPAVNDTFTALTCIDWLGESLCKVTTDWHPVRVHRDAHGYVRVITAHVSYQRLIERAFEKIRQAGRGMPAVLIRQLEALTKIMEHTTTESQRSLLLKQADMLWHAGEQSVVEPADLEDIKREYDRVREAAQQVESGQLANRYPTPGSVLM